MLFSSMAFSQVTISPWKMSRGGGIINYVLPNHSDPSAYSQANIPATSDAGWTAAPIDSNGAIHFVESSAIPSSNQCLKVLDFTYFETYNNIPANFSVNDLIVKFTAADDGARAYIFNSDHPTGLFIGNIQLGSTNS